MKKTIKWKKYLLLAGKIAAGSSLAIYTAECLHLQFSASAGIVTLLTLITTRKGTLRLSLSRLITFAFTAVLTWGTFLQIHSQWIAYGLFIFLIVLLCEVMDWRSTLSVNAVIGTHFLTANDYSMEFFLNEFLLVVIGILFASVLNLFHSTRGQKEHFAKEIQEVENRMQDILGELARYLSDDPQARHVWADIVALENRLQELLPEACEYEGNTFSREAAYFSRYFEMRLSQCHILHNLHYEIRKIRSMPVQAKIVMQYILYMKAFVTELNEPTLQLRYLEDLFEKMKKEPLPVTREEFESRALLYHILMDLEEFLIEKKRFVTFGCSGAEAGKSGS